MKLLGIAMEHIFPGDVTVYEDGKVRRAKPEDAQGQELKDIPLPANLRDEVIVIEEPKKP